MQMLDEETQPDALMRQIAKTSQDQAASNPP